MGIALSRGSHALGNPWRTFQHGINESFASTKFPRTYIALISGIGYYAGTKIGFAFTPTHAATSTLWAPNAILLAILLLIPVRNWWVAVLVILPIHLMIQLRIGVPASTSTGWFISNVSEALLGAALVRRFTDPLKMFESVRGTVIFLGFAVLAAPLATSFVDVATVVVTGQGQHYWLIWIRRLFSNGLAELIFVPTIIGLASYSIASMQAKPVRCLEACGLGLALVVVSYLAFSFDYAKFHGSPALIYLPLTFLVWAALRFGVVGLGISVLTIAAIAVEGAMRGRGPFTFGSHDINVLPLQLLLCTAATPLMLLTAVCEERRQIEDSLRQIAQKLISAQEQERQRIARELHDDIGQQLVLVESELAELKEVVDVKGKAQLDDVTGKVSDISRTVRELSHGLHPSTIEQLGLQSSLKRLCRDVAALKGIEVRFEADGLDLNIPPAIALCLYRISQEALQNVVRHSRASEVSVQVKGQKGVIRLYIADNGSGFELNKVTCGLGLVGMHERLRAVKGELGISTGPGGGTTLDITVPVLLRQA